jgi:hypothetical protein
VCFPLCFSLLPSWSAVEKKDFRNHTGWLICCDLLLGTYRLIGSFRYLSFRCFPFSSIIYPIHSILCSSGYCVFIHVDIIWSN